MKIIVLAKSQGFPHRADSDFAGIAREFDALLRSGLDVDRCVVSRATDLREREDGRAAAFDTVLELWTGLAADSFFDRVHACIPCSDLQAYEAVEFVEKSLSVPLPQTKSPGVTWFVPLPAANGVAGDEVHRHYDEHVPLALRVHRAMDRYVRHRVVRALVPGSSPYFGFSCLHFPEDEAFLQRHYDSPAGQAAIRQDVIEFVSLDQLTPIAAREYALR